jgi:uncharacterized membrane protein YidH (DUF202 family)
MRNGLGTLRNKGRTLLGNTRTLLGNARTFSGKTRTALAFLVWPLYKAAVQLQLLIACRAQGSSATLRLELPIHLGP